MKTITKNFWLLPSETNKKLKVYDMNAWKRVYIIPHICEQRIEKKMHVCFYIVSETEKVTTINYVDIIQKMDTRD